VDEPRDSATFRMAVLGLGLSLVIAVIGIAVITAFGQQGKNGLDGQTSNTNIYWGPHKSYTPPGESETHHQNSVGKAELSIDGSHAARVPENLWLVVAALFGVLVGLLIPTPRLRLLPEMKLDTPGNGETKTVKRSFRERVKIPGLAGLIGFTLVVLFVAVFAATGNLGTSKTDGVLVAAFTVLLGILIPSPARHDPI
jgi:hypothetical protein